MTAVIKRLNFRNSKKTIEKVLFQTANPQMSVTTAKTQSANQSLFFSTFRSDDYLVTQDFLPNFERSFNRSELKELSKKSTNCSDIKAKGFNFRNRSAKVKRILAETDQKSKFENTQISQRAIMPKKKAFCFRNKSSVMKRIISRQCQTQQNGQNY